MKQQVAAGVDQTHQVIPVNSGDGPTLADIDNALTVLDVADRVLDGPYGVDYEYISDQLDPNGSLTVNLQAAFTNVPTDLRTKLPASLNLDASGQILPPQSASELIAMLPDPTFSGLFPDGLPTEVVELLFSP
jgi:hypothetical protein